MMATAVYRDLNNEQAHGVSCIVCGTEFTITGVHAAPSADRHDLACLPGIALGRSR
jgi:hypothetical protein